MEQAAGSIRELGLPSGRVGSRRLRHRLEGFKRIRLPTILSDSEMSDQDIEGAGGVDDRDTLLAGPALVPVAVRADVRTGIDSPEGGASDGTDGPIASAGAVDPSNRLAVVRDQMENSGFSGQVVELLLGGVRNSTSAAYQSAWNGWHSWCVQQGANPMSPPVTKVLEFLSWLVGKGKAYRTINLSRSMHSSTLGKIDGVDIGKHPMLNSKGKGAGLHFYELVDLLFAESEFVQVEEAYLKQNQTTRHTQLGQKVLQHQLFVLWEDYDRDKTDTYRLLQKLTRQNMLN